VDVHPVIIPLQLLAEDEAIEDVFPRASLTNSLFSVNSMASI